MLSKVLYTWNHLSGRGRGKRFHRQPNKSSGLFDLIKEKKWSSNKTLLSNSTCRGQCRENYQILKWRTIENLIWYPAKEGSQCLAGPDNYRLAESPHTL